MDRSLRPLGWTFLALAWLLTPAAPVAEAGHEPFAVAEGWTGRTMRSDRWMGHEAGLLDVERKIRGHALVMRARREGATASDVGFTTARHRLVAANPAAIDQLAATLRVRELAMSGCATNPGQPSRIIVSINLNKFNDGSGGPGNMTGDHGVTVHAYRESTSTDPEGTLRFRAFIGRCIDATCSNAFSIPGGVVDLPGTAAVGERFTLRAVWDPPNARFLVGAGDHPDVPISYPAEVNQQPAGVPFVDVRTLNVNANCTSGATVTDTTLGVGQIESNASAVIP